MPPAPPKLLHVFSTFDIGGPQARTAELIRCFGPALEHVLVAADGRTEAVRAFGLEAAVRMVAFAFAKSRGVALGNVTRIRRLLQAELPSSC